MDEKKKRKLEIIGSSCCEPSQSPGCDPTQISCCDTSDSFNSVDYSNQVPPSSMVQGEISTQKLKVDIYVPLEACSCEWTQFMNLIFSALTPYIRYINHETRSLNSEEARNLNLTKKCVIIDGKKKYTTSHALKDDLPSLLKEKGLL